MPRHFLYVIHGSVDYTDREQVHQALAGSMKGGLFKQAWRGTTDEGGRFTSHPLEAGEYMLVFGDVKRDVERVQVEHGRTANVTLYKR